MNYIWDYLQQIFFYSFIFFIALGIIYAISKFKLLKKDIVWDGILKKIRSDIKKMDDKELNKLSLLKKSYINSVDEITDLLIKIYNSGEKEFKLTPLEAALIFEIFPGEILKSKKGKYYLLSRQDFLFFIKLLVNKNHIYISDEMLQQIKEDLVKTFLRENNEKMVIDAENIFQILKSSSLPSDSIKEQRFIEIGIEKKINDKSLLFKIDDKEYYEELLLQKTGVEINNANYNKKEENENSLEKINTDKNQNKNFFVFKTPSGAIHISDVINEKQYFINPKKKSEDKKIDKDLMITKTLEGILYLLSDLTNKKLESVYYLSEQIANLQENSSINKEQIKGHIENLNEEEKEKVEKFLENNFGIKLDKLKNKNENDTKTQTSEGKKSTHKNIENNSLKPQNNSEEISNNLEEKNNNNNQEIANDNIKDNEDIIEEVKKEILDNGVIEENENHDRNTLNLLDELSNDSFFADFGLSTTQIKEKQTDKELSKDEVVNETNIQKKDNEGSFEEFFPILKEDDLIYSKKIKEFLIEIETLFKLIVNLLDETERDIFLNKSFNDKILFVKDLIDKGKISVLKNEVYKRQNDGKIFFAVEKEAVKKLNYLAIKNDYAIFSILS